MQCDNKNEDISITHKVWNSLNINKNSFIQIIKIQENWIFIGTRNSMITKNVSNKYGKYCKGKEATINYILLSYGIMKKMQIEIHDFICKKISISNTEKLWMIKWGWIPTK